MQFGSSARVWKFVFALLFTVFGTFTSFAQFDQFGQPLFNQFRSREDSGPPAALYLAVRAARRALIDNPSDARAHAFRS